MQKLDDGAAELAVEQREGGILLHRLKATAANNIMRQRPIRDNEWTRAPSLSAPA